MSFKNSSKNSIKRVSSQSLVKKFRESSNKINNTNLNISSISKNGDMSFLDEYLLNEQNKEDKRITAEYYKLIRIDELINCVLLLMTLACSFVYNETKFCSDDCSENLEIQNDIINISLIFSSISSLIFIIVLILKYYHYFLLYKSAKYLPNYENFFKTSLFRYLILEFIFALLHPNMLFKNINFTTSINFNQKKVEYCINDLLLLFQCLRLLYLILIFPICSDFYCPRADRVCKMMGRNLDLSFSLRALFIEKTLTMLLYCSIIICIMLSYMLKILNQPLEITRTNNFKNFGNCFWYVLVTMTTVGYGDIYPETTMERIIGYAIAISGTVVVALIVSFFQEQITLENNEKNTLEFVERVNGKEELMEASVTYFKMNMLYLLNKRKMEKGSMPQSEFNKNYLIKLLKERIEAKKKFKSLFHQFHIHFKMENDVDKIKKKIDNLDFAQTDLSQSINELNNKIRELLNNLNGITNLQKKNKSKSIKKLINNDSIDSLDTKKKNKDELDNINNINNNDIKENEDKKDNKDNLDNIDNEVVKRNNFFKKNSNKI